MILIKNNLDCRENVCFILNDDRNPYSHIHSQLEFLYVLRGTATVITAERTYHLQPEEFMVFPAFELHTVTGDETLQTLSLYIAPRIPELLQQPAPTGRIACLSTRRPADTPLYNAIRQRLANLFYHYTLSDITERALFWGDCFQLLDLCNQVEEEAPAGGDVPAEGRHHIARVVQYMSAHYTEPLTLQGMAQREFISPGHLSKLFKTILGCTFLQYFNILRLAHALTDLMQPANTITDIAMNHGFRSTNRFIHLFREQFGQTPGQYRQTLKNHPREAFSPESRTALFNPLLRHMRQEQACAKTVLRKRCETEAYQVSFTAPGTPLAQTWRRILNIGTASDGLLAPVQAQIRRAQRELGFTHIRLSGILDDNILILRFHDANRFECNFVYIDLLLDFCLSLGLKPYMEFSFMPPQLAVNQSTRQLSPSCISAPRDYFVWGKLIRKVLQHLLERYGKSELEQWFFSPMRSTYQSGNLLDGEDYLRMYRIFHQIIKQEYALPLCGFGNDLDLVFQEDGAFCRTFLELCRKHDCYPDYLAMQSFNCLYGDVQTGQQNFLLQDAEPWPLSDDPEYLRNRLQKFQELLAEIGAPPIPLILEDWGFSQWQRDPRNDTAYKATFLVKNVLDTIDRFSLMSSLKLTDLMEETSTKQRIFHGGSGLMTVNGIPKSGYYAMQFLNRLGPTLLCKQDDMIVTRRGDAVQILLFRYCHSTSLSNQYYQLDADPYSAFVTRLPKQFDLTLSDLTPGQYVEEFFSISPQNGSSYDAWLRMGAPEILDEYQVRYLSQTAVPAYKTCTETIQGAFHFTTTLAPHEIQLITLRPQY